MTLVPQIKQECRVINNASVDLLEVCDSVIAVLTAKQLEEWTSKFNELTKADTYVNEGWTWGSVLQVFDIDNKLFTIVSDACGEWMAEVFAEFCTDNNIAHQGVIDSLDCENMPVEDIYTGAADDDPELLALLHKVYNNS
jgi:hypothetical protein